MTTGPRREWKRTSGKRRATQAIASLTTSSSAISSRAIWVSSVRARLSRPSTVVTRPDLGPEVSDQQTAVLLPQVVGLLEDLHVGLDARQGSEELV
jgi:hypothetical protein